MTTTRKLLFYYNVSKYELFYYLFQLGCDNIIPPPPPPLLLLYYYNSICTGVELIYCWRERVCVVISIVCVMTTKERGTFLTTLLFCYCVAFALLYFCPSRLLLSLLFLDCSAKCSKLVKWYLLYDDNVIYVRLFYALYIQWARRTGSWND